MTRSIVSENAGKRKPAWPMHSELMWPQPYLNLREETEPAAFGEPESAGLNYYRHILAGRKWTLLLAAVIFGAAAWLLTKMQAPIYRARTLIEIENLNDDFLHMRDVSPTSSTATFQSPESTIRTQTIILQSRPVLERAVDRMDLWKRIALNMQKKSSLPWQKSQPTARQTTDTARRDLAIAAVSRAMKVRNEPNTRIVEISFESTDPRIAADAANSIADNFIDLSLDQRAEASHNTSQWLTRQLEDLKTKLLQSEEAAQRYALSSNLTFLSEKDNVVEEKLRQLQLELSKAQADRVTMQSKYELAATTSPESLPDVLDDSLLKDYQGQMTTLSRLLADLTSTFTPASIKVQKARAEMAAVQNAFEQKRASILARIGNEYQAATRREKLLTQDYTNQVGVMAEQSAKVTHYSILKREVDTTRTLYDSMMQRVKEASLASALRANDIHVIDPARAPATPSRPDVRLNTLFGSATGLLLAGAVVVVQARSGRGIGGPGELSQRLSVPELGVIPVNPKLKPVMFSSRRRPQGPAALLKGASVFAESFRLALISILPADRSDRRHRVIALCSVKSGEGKTTVVSNLALALAGLDYRVLLVDGDMWQPRLHRIFGVDNSVGLSEVLAEVSSTESPKPLPIVKTAISNLSLLPSGKHPNKKLLFGQDLPALLRRLASDYDMVLIDTPPLLQFSDARLMGRSADAVILVVGQNTDKDAVLLARQQLAEDGSYLLGAILNNWDPKTSLSGFRAYNSYYKSAYKEAQSV